MTPSGSKNFRLILIVSFIALLVGYGIYEWRSESASEVLYPATKPLAEPEFTLEGKLSFINKQNEIIRTVDIEIADNDPDRARGLMYRSALSDQQGMLFIFDQETDQSFWMKNTKISLDILYVSADKEIVTMYRYTQPYSESPIPSFKPAQYVVEVRGGFCDQYGIKEGDLIRFEQN